MDDEHDDIDFESLYLKPAEALEAEELTPAGIASVSQALLGQQNRFRHAADVVTLTLATFAEVQGIVLFGSVARPLRKEIPRFRRFRRAGIAVWHECKDVDLAIWLNQTRRLGIMRQAMEDALSNMYMETGNGTALHQVDAFLFEPTGDSYLGRLCDFELCPAGKDQCLVPGCGARAFLRQIEDFRLWKDALAPSRAVPLFDRAHGTVTRAGDLPRQTDVA